MRCFSVAILVPDVLPILPLGTGTLEKERMLYLSTSVRVRSRMNDSDAVVYRTYYQ